VDPCLQAGIPLDPDQCQPSWLVYQPWIIRFGSFTLNPMWALAYVHPDWLGRDPHKNSFFGTLTPEDRALSASNDLALLYVGDDRRLPPRVEDDGAFRLSLDTPPASTSSLYSFFGWADGSLKQSRSNGDVLFTAHDSTIGGVILNDQASVTCAGDSGGPLVRNVVVPTNDHGTIGRNVIAGVNSLGLADCSTAPPGFEMTFTRVDGQLEFIETAMKNWNGPGFTCLKRSAANDPLDEIGECWGAPCSDDSACGDAPAYCSRAGQDFTTCDTCGSANDCNCVIGQCLPGPLGQSGP
jgi:hypothetical protein